MCNGNTEHAVTNKAAVLSIADRWSGLYGDDIGGFRHFVAQFIRKKQAECSNGKSLDDRLYCSHSAFLI
jgi:hypothetical protein